MQSPAAFSVILSLTKMPWPKKKDNSLTQVQQQPQQQQQQQPPQQQQQHPRESDDEWYHKLLCMDKNEVFELTIKEVRFNQAFPACKLTCKL